MISGLNETYLTKKCDELVILFYCTDRKYGGKYQEAENVGAPINTEKMNFIPSLRLMKAGLSMIRGTNLMDLI